jgi:hypothetical protein
LLSGTLTGEKRIFPKKASFFLENQKVFSQNSSKISTSEQGAQEAQTKFVFAQTKFVFANYPKKSAIFWQNWPWETARVVLVVILKNLPKSFKFL